MIYCFYNNFEKINFFQPSSIQLQNSNDFYLICQGYMIIPEEVINSFIDQLEIIQITGINFDQMNDKYPLSYLYQLIFVLDKLVTQSVYLLEKDYFFLNNNTNSSSNILTNKFAKLINTYFIEHNIEWMIKYKI
jgi:hypothetical protein